jgi:hypothetical protein
MSLQKTVERLEWDSFGGQTLYREVYNDGTRSAQTSVPDMPTNLPPDKFRRKKEQLEAARIGKVVQFADPSPQRRF